MATEAVNVERARMAVEAGYAVRRMHVPDADRVARVHVRVWREAYSSLLPAEHLDGLDVDELTDRWRERLVRPGTDAVRHLVGLHPDGRIVGLGTAGETRDPEPSTAWELWALNVLAEVHGTGLADLMMSELTGTRACSLWVLRGNARAVAFYVRHGFRADGETKVHEPTGIPEDRMVRRQRGRPVAQSGAGRPRVRP